MNSATPRQQLLKAIEALSDRQIVLIAQFIQAFIPKSAPQLTDTVADPVADFIGTSNHGNLASAVEFQAEIENGVIRLPEQYRPTFEGTSTVTVVLEPARQQESDIFDQLTQHPIPVDRFLTRDEIYDRL